MNPMKTPVGKAVLAILIVAACAEILFALALWALTLSKQSDADGSTGPGYAPKTVMRVK
jgi:hypothetical protein